MNSENVGFTIAIAVCCCAIGIAVVAYNIKPSPKLSKKGTNSGKSSSKPSNVSDDTTVDDGLDENSLRGYKKLKDGRVTSYFNRELSSEDKSIIGDCSPKLLSSNGVAVSTPSSPTPSSNPTTVASAWNTAGTWEEKDCSKFCAEKLTKLLQSVTFSSPGNSGNVNVVSVKSVEGEAAVTMIRGKKKYVYDYTVQLEFKAHFAPHEIVGVMTVADITGEQNYEMSTSFSCPTAHFPAPVRDFLKQFISAANKGFQLNLKTEIDRLLNELQAAY